MKSIGTKLVLQIALAIVFVMTGFSGLALYQQRQGDVNFLKAKEARLLEQLPIILGGLLYEFNEVHIETIVRSYLKDPDIWAITVLSNGEAFCHLGKSLDRETIIDFRRESEQFPYPNSSVRSISIIHANEEIGKLEVVFSRHFVTQQTQRAMTTIGSGLILIILAESLVVLTLIRRNVSRPLAELVEAAQQIAVGIVDVRLEHVSSRDEIGRLNAAFETMVHYIQNMASVATRISGGDLDHDVQLRSDHDVLGLAFTNMISYLREIAETAAAIAGGDFRRHVRPQSEHDVLGQAFQMMNTVRRLIEDIITSVERLQTAVTDLEHISVQLASEAEELSQQTHVISSSSEQISENADVVAKAAEEMSANIHDLSRNTEGMTSVAGTGVEKTHLTASVMVELDKRSQEISDIISVITSITQQTNLLALNATIEAARAGEFGKGFAVVAHEIKNLSQETATSTENIIRKLEFIRSGSQDATTAIHEAADIITRIHDLATSTARGIEQQSGTTGEITRRMVDVAYGSKGITQAITEVAGATENSSQSADRVQQSAQNLAALAEDLQSLVTQFKI